jgi:uncharacterized protein
MHKRLADLLLVLLVLALDAHAADRSARDLAEELLPLMNVQQNFEQMMRNVKQIQLSQLQKMNPPGTNPAQSQTRFNQFMNLMDQEFSWSSLKPDYVDVYANTFTEQELSGLIDFYKSPLGRKLVEKTPTLMNASLKITERRMEAIRPKIEQLMQDWAKEQNAPAR